MTTLRVVPFLPFWFVNVAPVLFDVDLRDFALSTLIGILPVSANSCDTVHVNQCDTGHTSHAF